MSKVLVLGDIHGRKFWKNPCKTIDSYDKVVFLGDYLDPYQFEDINVKDAIENFAEIIDLKKNNPEKVVLLIGNHDLPYFSDDYYALSNYHCRHSDTYHDTIHKMFNDNLGLFQIAHVVDDALFTHAGVDSGWLEQTVGCTSDDIHVICDDLNKITNDPSGWRKLYCVSYRRGGDDEFASCVWADINDINSDWLSAKNVLRPSKAIHTIKQVFGHTLQAYYGDDDRIMYGEPLEFGNHKMLDVARPFLLDTKSFTLTPLC